MKIVILDEAEQDLIAGFHFYERHQEGLGDYFLDSLYGDIDSLLIYAGVHVVVFGKHRMLAKRFPCGIYYTVHDDLIPIHAVLDLRREPAWIRQRLD